MFKKTGYTLALLSLAVPTADLFAADPSNAELYKMIMDLKKELVATKSENKELRTMIDKQSTPVSTEDRGSLSSSGGGTAKTSLGAAVDTSAPVKHKEIPLTAKNKDSYLILESADGGIQYKVDGRIMLDAGFVSDREEGNRIRPDMEVRRARFALKTTLYKDWASEFDINLVSDKNSKVTTTSTTTGTDSTGKAIKATTKTKSSVDDPTEIKAEIQDLWIAYNGFPHTTLKLGNHKAPFSMDEVTTSRWGTFMETSMVTDTFKPGRRLGFSVTHWENSYYFGTGIFGDSPAVKTQDDDTGGSERFAWSARGAYRPYLSSDGRKMVHVGANYLSLYPERVDDNVFSYSSRPEAHFVDYKFIDTDDIKNVENVSTWGLEAAGKWDKFYTQAEYMRSKVNTETGAANPNPEFSGWYAMVAYFLTDDERPYNLEDAEFGPVVPNGRWGGLELALRYSVLDLNDIAAGVTGGEEQNITVGLNWYVNNNFILRGNYIRVNNDQYANKKGKGIGNDDVNIYGMRAEYLF